MKTTANLGLKKPEGTDVVNIDDFNYNADVIDTELQKRALKTEIPTVPVQSVNGKTGTVSLTATDVGAATSAQGIKADTALQSSQLGQAGGPAKQDDLASHLADNLYQTAGGTATAITLTINGTLTNGYPITFIASANNNGSATTINGKSLYKPNTTTAPTLIAGKAYTVWYNATSNCFFIKASAEGNTVASHVLAGDKFSTDVDTGLVGTMSNYSNGDVAANNISGTSNGIIHLRPPEGYYGNGHSLYWNDDNFIASNIISGKSIFGLAGSATVASLGGRRYATSTVNVDGNNNSDTGRVIVSGLSFTPSMVFIYRTANPSVSWKCYVRDYNTDKQVFLDGTGFTYLSGWNNYVTNGGFKLFGSADSGGTFISNTWIAIE